MLTPRWVLLQVPQAPKAKKASVSRSPARRRPGACAGAVQSGGPPLHHPAVSTWPCPPVCCATRTAIEGTAWRRQGREEYVFSPLLLPGDSRPTPQSEHAFTLSASERARIVQGPCCLPQLASDLAAEGPSSHHLLAHPTVFLDFQHDGIAHSRACPRGSAGRRRLGHGAGERQLICREAMSHSALS